MQQCVRAPVTPAVWEVEAGPGMVAMMTTSLGPAFNGRPCFKRKKHNARAGHSDPCEYNVYNVYSHVQTHTHTHTHTHKTSHTQTNTQKGAYGEKTTNHSNLCI